MVIKSLSLLLIIFSLTNIAYSGEITLKEVENFATQHKVDLKMANIKVHKDENILIK